MEKREKTAEEIFGSVLCEAYRFATANNVVMAKNDYMKYTKVFQVVKRFLADDLARYEKEYKTVDYYDYNFSFSDHFKVLERIEAEEIADMDDRFVNDVCVMIDQILEALVDAEKGN